MAFYAVAPLAVARQDTYTYAGSAELPVGSVVQIPYANRQVLGVVLGPESPLPRAKSAQPTDIVLGAPQLALARFIATEYVAPLGLVLRGFLKEEVIKYAPATKPAPTAAGRFAATWHSYPSRHQTYQQLIQHSPSLVVVPDVSDIAPLQQQLGGVAYHSRLTPKQRATLWWEVAAGTPDLIIGTRSALLLPWRRLRTLIIDQEQSLSHKSEQTPMWHARAVAFRLARELGSDLHFGSVAPSLELFRLAEEGQVAERQQPWQPSPLVVIDSAAQGEQVSFEIEQAIATATRPFLYAPKRQRPALARRFPKAVIGDPDQAAAAQPDVAAAVGLDVLLQLPDYRAAESAFATLCQLRACNARKVYVQTAEPSHPVISAQSGGYAAFARAELAERRALGLPPYQRLTRLTLAGSAATLDRQERELRQLVEPHEIVTLPVDQGQRRFLVKGPPARLAGLARRAAACEVDPLTATPTA